MKKSLTLALFFLLGMLRLSAQSNTGALGGEATGSGGSASFTAGEVFYTFKTGATVSSTDGVQQTYSPTIISFTPSSGAPGTLVTITGTDLNGLSAFTIGGVRAIAVSNTGATLVGMVMPGASTGAVAVTTPGGSATSAGTFTVQNTPFPIAQQGTKLTASNDLLTPGKGWSVALSADGKTALVGGYFDNNGAGATWVYTRSGNTWAQQTKLIGTGNTGNAWQGFSVALSADGNTAIVGGVIDDGGKGAVWFFSRSGSTWTPQDSKKVGSDVVGGAEFGKSVALSADGNTALVGGWKDNASAGAGWIFTRSGSTWAQQGTKLVGTGALGAAGQGTTVSLSADGTIAAIGGAYDDSQKGATWIFTRSGNTWVHQKIVVPGVSGAARQGQSVALSADATTLIIGGINATSNVSNAWVYTRSGSTWTQQGTTITGSDAIGTAANGTNVSLSADGNTAMMGSVSDNGNRGAAWVFTRSGNTYTQKGNKLVATGAVGTALYMGRSVAISADGTNMLVGADGDATNKGATWSYAIGVTYDGNGNTSGTVPASQLATLGSSVTLATNTGTLVKTGYTFAGWNTLANGTGTSYASGVSITFNVSLPLYAQWSPNNYNITFNGNGSTGGSMSAQSITYLASANLTANAFTRPGYTFAGWNTLAAGTGTSYANSASYTMGASNVTLYAQWTINNYNITFNGNGSTGGSMSAQSITYLASANLTANAFTRTGFTFFRWNTAADGTGTSYTNSGSFTMGASDVTLYAQWLLIPPVITNISPATATTVPGATVTITGTNFNTTAANNIVRFGTVKASVSAATTTSLTVTAPVGATYAPVTVFNTSMILSGSSSKPFLPTFAGKGSFTKDDIMPKVDFATTGTQQPYYVAIGDIDGDGKPDLVVANYANGTVSVYHNTSTSGSITNASFAARVDFATGANPISVAIGDLNGDGKPELAVTNNGSASVSVFRNTASSGSITTASFAAKVDYTVGTNPRSVAIVDLDGDGKADLAVANTAVFTVSVLRNTSASGTISFLPKVDYATGANPHYVAFGDLDGDGKPDLATANNGNASVSVLRNNSIAGTIALEAKVDFTAGTAPVSLAIGDLDADGKAEMVVTNFGNAGISVFKNNAVSGFITSTSFDAKVDFTTGTGAWSVAIGDLDGDGKPDLAVANTGVNTVSVLRNISTASSITTSSFAAKVDFATATGTRSVAIGDLDLDGKPDFVAANYNNATISVFRNNPSAFVSFNANVGTGTMVKQKISYLASANLTANAFTRTGYTFTGWNTAADGTGTAYANLASYTMGASDVTLFAQWSINNYNITFDGNASDGGSMSPITIVYTGSANLTPNGFTRTGYTFAGWATSAAGVVVYADFANYTMGAADVTLYAKWTINNYVISYDANGGTGSMLDQTLVYNTSAALRNNTFTRTGYTFAGWNTAANGSGTAYANLVTYTMGAADVTMYAQWSINDYTITYDGNGSSAGSMSAQTIPYNTILNFTANGFTRTGYVFYGWNTEANGTGTAYANSASYTMGASDVTLYAQWVICTWTGASNGDWNDASNWNANEVPTGGIDVVIPAGTVNAISTGGSFSSKSVSIQAGATVSISSSGVWNIVGNLQGAAGSVITGTGKVVLNGSSAQNIEGTVSVSNLEINNNAVQIATGSSLSILPTASNPNALLTLLSASSLTNNGNLILRSNSFGTGSIGPIPANATLGGNITQERLMPSANGWYFVGAPVKSSTLTEWSELNPRISPKLNGTLFEYSESDSSAGVASEVNGWKVPNTLAAAINPSNQPKGYRIHLGASNPTRLASVTGLPFVQDVNKALTFSPTTGYAGGGWNLISNPYPCAINWNQMRNNASNSGLSLSNAYYTWNGTTGNYGSYTSLGAGTGVGVGGLQENIPSSQAFFVKANGAGNLAFKESFKNTAANSASFLRTATSELEFLKFKVQQGSNWDEAGILFYPGSEEGEDKYDALNLMGSAVDVAMVMTGGKNASIGVLPEIGDQRVIPLKVRTPSNGAANFRFEGMENFPALVTIYLKDDYLGTLTDIRQHPDVSFESVASQSYNRFSLVLLTINLRVETENVEKKALRIFPNPAQTVATVFSPLAGELELFNAMGQKVKTQTILIGQSRLDVSGLPKGMYWIRMEGMAEEKLIVE